MQGRSCRDGRVGMDMPLTAARLPPNSGSMALDSALQQRLGDLIGENKVLLFMKGSRHFPQCGFSATVTQILDGLVSDYKTVNVLTDPEVRSGIKELSNWPTIPQLYVEGQFVGGCDIIREMYIAGELQTLLGVTEDVDAPKISISEAAVKAFAAAQDDGESALLRLEVSTGFEYALSMDQPQKGDYQVDAGHGVIVLIDRDSARRANGVSIDYTDAEGGGGFKIENPNAPEQA